MIPPWGRGSSSRGIAYGRNVLSGGRSRHGGGSSGGCRCGGDGNRARVGGVGRGKRRLPHFGLEAMSSARLHHGWAGEGEEIERMGGGEVLEMILE